jgi:hypothetical protein
VARSVRELIWYSRLQPQTLQGAVALLYLNAVLSAIYALIDGAGISGILILIDVAAGLGIANDRRWGYVLGLLAAAVPIVLFFTHIGIGDILNLLFWIALMAMLLHTHSRAYIRTYFH